MEPQEKFWDWFARHDEELFNFDPHDEVERERIFGELISKLKNVDPDLAFEFGPNTPKREFVISAGGVRRAFPAVIALAQAAPPLVRWQVIAFRPRRTPVNSLKFRGKQVDPSGVQFSLLDNGNIAGHRLFVPGFRDGDADWMQVAYLLLDEALGEYDVETRLGLIKIHSIDAQTKEERYPLSELPKLFDQLVSRLEGRSGEPS